MNWLLVTCLAAFALVAAKLLGFIAWPWWYIAAPLWLWAGIVLILVGLLAALWRSPR